MRNSKINFVILFFIVINGCTCKKQVTRWDIDKDVLFKVKLQDTNRILKIGDTVKLSIEVPDTILTKQNDTISIESVQEANVFIKLGILDSTSRAKITFDGYSVISKIGNVENSSKISFDLLNRPTSLSIYYILNKRGIYQFSQSSDQGRFFFNEFIKARSSINFIVNRSNSDLSTPYFGDSLKQLYDTHNDLYGKQYYFFEVK